MRCGVALLSLAVWCFSDVVATNVDIVADKSTPWEAPTHVSRCPLHKNFKIEYGGPIGVRLSPPGGGKFSVIQKQFPASTAVMMATSTGLIIRYTSPPLVPEVGATGVSLWRVRVSSATDHHVRFTHLFSIPAKGVQSETRYMPWKDFHGQIIERTKKVHDCRQMPPLPALQDVRCTMTPETLTHVSFLESEDTIAHAITLHSVVVTTDPINERNAVQHHTEEDAALVWEREHHAATTQHFDYNGTHYTSGGDCHSHTGVCRENATVIAKPTDGPGAPQGVIGISGAPQASPRYLWVVAFAAVGCALSLPQ